MAKNPFELEAVPLGSMFNGLVKQVANVDTSGEVVPAVDVKMSLQMSHTKRGGFLWSKKSDSSIVIELATRIQRSHINVSGDGD